MKPLIINLLCLCFVACGSYSERNSQKLGKKFFEYDSMEYYNIKMYEDIVTKICFSCIDIQIQGANANIESFGQAEDYRRLENVLKNNQVDY